MLGVGSEPHLSGLHDNNISSNGLGVYFSESGCLQIHSCIQKIDCGISRIEIGEEE